MKRILFVLFYLPLFVKAQNKPLMIEGSAAGLYLNHTVAVKENYYSVGRLYNISPKEIAPFNNMELEKGLSLNQQIKIPLTANNFIQFNAAAADEALIPVYHTVKEKEGLYRISTTYNKIAVETLKQWNNIKGDAVSNGTKLIVGYLKVKKDLSPLSGMAKALPAVSPPAATVVIEVPVKEKAAAARPDISNETLPVVKNPAKEKPAAVKPAASEPVAAKEPAAVKKEEPAAVKETPAPKEITPARAAKNFNGGYFKNDFDKQTLREKITAEKGTGGIFKSTSGWEDGKYYCLHNTATPGTILKVTSTATGKSIYAKVLDMIPDMNQNDGILLRLSNAAAAELGTGENKFDCSINFSK